MIVQSLSLSHLFSLFLEFVVIHSGHTCIMERPCPWVHNILNGFSTNIIDVLLKLVYMIFIIWHCVHKRRMWLFCNFSFKILIVFFLSVHLLKHYWTELEILWNWAFMKLIRIFYVPLQFHIIVIFTSRLM